jgi:hypothetical protein
LRDLIAVRPERFARGFTEALIEYGLGRPYGFSDQDLADAILLKAKDENFNARVFIQTLVASPQFRSK